jgi:uncharacterized protein (TIRG00374 family)
MFHLSIFTQFFVKNCAKVPAGSFKFKGTMKKLIAFSMFVMGIVLFISMLRIAGVDNIIEPFKKFSLFYLILFLLTVPVLQAISTMRWATILKYQGIKVPFLILLRYKIIGAAISYVTPASRIGGEPVRALLFKEKFGLKSKQAFPAIIMETTLGMFIDVVLIALILLTMLLFSGLHGQVAGIALVLSLVAIVLLTLFYHTLIKRLGPFSFVIRVGFFLTKSIYLKKLIRKMVDVEKVIAEFLHFKKKGLAQAILVSMLSWPVTFLQYKFALLSIGFDASAIIIFLSIIATTLTALVPIPAALGIQEVGHLSVFGLIASPGIGIALTLLIRFKDILLTLAGLLMLSHEGLSIFEILKQKNKK